MKNLLFSLFGFLSLIPSTLYGQISIDNLSRHQADSLSNMHFVQAVSGYADVIEGNWQAGCLQNGEYQMPFECYINGERPNTGYPLYISLHGGGGTTAQENDQQWENQKNLYGAVPGIYFVPRSPTDTWNMWHQDYMEGFLLQIISYSVVRFGADQSRVYLLGYSAGGDGVYNLATRLSDRFAAAAMMAGHPGDAQIENLRNLPFAIYVGAEDTAYNRAGLAVEWLRDFERLYAEDQGGFAYNINIYEGKGHWMDGLDSSAIGWLANFIRVSVPSRIIWIQDDVLHTRKHNLEVSNPKQGDRIEQVVDFANNTIYLYSDSYSEVTIWLDDYIVNLDKAVKVIFNNREVFNGTVYRQEENIVNSISRRLDPEHVYWGKITVQK